MGNRGTRTSWYWESTNYVRRLAHKDGICGIRALRRTEPLGLSRRLGPDAPDTRLALLTRLPVESGTKLAAGGGVLARLIEGLCDFGNGQNRQRGGAASARS